MNKYVMRALTNPGPGYVTWESRYPDMSGINAGTSIQAGTTTIIGYPNQINYPRIGKLDTTYSPVVLYQFESNLNDSSGNNFHLSGTPLTYMNTSESGTTGVVSAGSAFNRPSRDATLAITGAMTIQYVGTFLRGPTSCWITSMGSSWDDGAGNSNTIWSSIVGWTGQLAWFHESGGGNNYITWSVNRVPMGIPCHIAMTRDSSNPANIIFYLNGKVFHTDSTLPAATGGTDSDVVVRIFGDNAGSPALRGTTLSSLKINNSVLTADQIKAEYNRTLGGRSDFWKKEL